MDYHKARLGWRGSGAEAGEAGEGATNNEAASEAASGVASENQDKVIVP